MSKSRINPVLQFPEGGTVPKEHSGSECTGHGDGGFPWARSPQGAEQYPGKQSSPSASGGLLLVFLLPALRYLTGAAFSRVLPGSLERLQHCQLHTLGLLMPFSTLVLREVDPLSYGEIKQGQHRMQHLKLRKICIKKKRSKETECDTCGHSAAGISAAFENMLTVFFTIC